MHLPAQVARERAEVLVSRLQQRLAQLLAEVQITAKVAEPQGRCPGGRWEGTA